jgi:hypothetical protein
MKLILCALAVLLYITPCLYGCGGGGGGSGTVISRTNRAQFSEDAIILAARTATGPWIPADTTAEIDQDLHAIRAANPQVTDVHAFPDFDLNVLIFAVKTTSPWVNNWRSGSITTGESALDSLIHQYDPASIKDNLFESNGNAWFTLQFGGPLNMTKLAEKFQGISINVPFVNINGYGGDGNRVTFSRPGSDKLYTFSKGWGDCPAGCIHRHSWEFTLKPDGTISLREFGDPL